MKTKIKKNGRIDGLAIYFIVFNERKNMYLETRIDKNGNETYVVIERYKDPFTNKTKRASVSFKQNSPKAIRQAERELLDKIDKIINDIESKYKSNKNFRRINRTLVFNLVYNSQT